ncbi:MAG: exodeoxyribonuclease I [Patescibacteria group bacterium]
MGQTFYFYDLETSGVTPRKSRIMQFAGQRTNDKLEPVGEPDDLLIQLNRDVLPDPGAVLIHGITPQKTLQDGITEAEFVKYFDENIRKHDTIFIGFNNIRFDDEFMRFLFWRNFHDPYEWQWKDGCSRWDVLDLVRITRALRPDGIKWPNDSSGKALNRLESLTTANKIEHVDAHTALSDVNATIAVAKLIKDTNPKLFDFMLGVRDKKKIRSMVNAKEPFVYVSGRYETRFEKMTIAVTVAELEDSSGVIVYDLRYDPNLWAKKTDKELSEALSDWQAEAGDRLPFKILQYNRCPSIAPRSVLDENSKQRLGVHIDEINRNIEALTTNTELIKRAKALFEAQKKAFQTGLLPDERDPDERLYDGFLPDSDRELTNHLRSLNKDTINDFTLSFQDGRLNGLFPLYKARNFPKSLSSAEREAWDMYVAKRLFEGGDKSQIAQFAVKLQEAAGLKGLTQNQQYLLEELKLYVESITPGD